MDKIILSLFAVDFIIVTKQKTNILIIKSVSLRYV